MRLTSAFVILIAAGCGGDGSNGDGAGPDSGLPALDANTSDSAIDGGNSLYSVSGECGVLDIELTDDMTWSFDSNLGFEREYSDADEELLSAGAITILDEGNAGGSSLLSEVFAFEVLSACEDAVLLKTETAIDYDVEGKKTDFLATIDGVKIGVSVTRAQTFPLGSEFTEERARELLEDKLGDILESSANVSAADAWEKQILAVLVYNQDHRAALNAAMATLDTSITSDTIVWLTVTDGPDLPIYE